jgi:quinol monooxygenase YgiN
MASIVLVATLHAKEGKETEALEWLKEHQANTQQEPGCRLYALHLDESDPRAMVLIEMWDDQESIQAHMDADHFEKSVAASEGLLVTTQPEMLRLVPQPCDHPKGSLKGSE